MVGIGFDSGASDILWRFAAGDGGAALATIDTLGDGGTVGGAIGIDTGVAITADRWYVFRIEIDRLGFARGYAADILNQKDSLNFVGRSTAALGLSDQFHALCMIENRSGANETMEVDYFFARGFRDWRAD